MLNKCFWDYYCAEQLSDDIKDLPSQFAGFFNWFHLFECYCFYFLAEECYYVEFNKLHNVLHAGFMLFLSLMIDRLHYYIRELRLLRKTMEAAKKQNRNFEDGKNGSPEELKAMGEEIATLRAKIKKLESECETKAKEAKTAEAEAEALRKQSEGVLLEYDRLLEDNQNLRNQLESIDQSLTQPDNKKNM